MPNWGSREDVVSWGLLCFIIYLAIICTVQEHIRISPCFLVLPSNLDPLNRLSDSEIEFQDCSCGELIFVFVKCADDELQVSLYSLFSSWFLSTDTFPLEQLLLYVQVTGITPRFATLCIPMSLVRVDWCQLYGM
jgi:hypothetical protein